MKKGIIFLIIIIFLFFAYFINICLQKLISPRKSFGRLMLYFLVTLVLVFVLTFSMVFIIGKLYPVEIMK